MRWSLVSRINGNAHFFSEPHSSGRCSWSPWTSLRWLCVRTNNSFFYFVSLFGTSGAAIFLSVFSFCHLFVLLPRLLHSRPTRRNEFGSLGELLIQIFSFHWGGMLASQPFLFVTCCGFVFDVKHQADIKRASNGVIRNGWSRAYYCWTCQWQCRTWALERSKPSN